MIVSIYPNEPLAVETMDVPQNGGACVGLRWAKGSTLWLDGYGAPAAANARQLAADLIAAADSIDAHVAVEAMAWAVSMAAPTVTKGRE